MKLKKILAGVTVAAAMTFGVASPAMAANLYIFEVGNNNFFEGYDAPGSSNVADYYSITVPSESILTAAVISDSGAGRLWGFSSLALSLQEWVSGAWQSISAANLGTGIDLSAGSYLLAVTGTTSGHFGGFYTGNAILTGDATFAVAPVPVPGAILLFGSGLLGLAGFARRHRRSVRAVA